MGSEEKFLSFAEDYDDTLGGVAQYRAASIQYGDGRFSESADTFLSAAKRLQGDPLAGRAKIGHAVSLIKDGKADEGRSRFTHAIAGDGAFLNADRFEALYLLGVDALSTQDQEEFEAQKKALGEKEAAADYLTRLVEFQKIHKLYEQAKSLPDINLAKGAEYLARKKKGQGVKKPRVVYCTK